jgi:hypothetical protein
MLRATFLAFISIASSAFAENAPIADPPELVTARVEYSRSMLRVSIPVLTQYLRQLDSQKLIFTRAGKLNEAIAVDQEIKVVTERLRVANLSVSKPAAVTFLTIQSVTFGDLAKHRVVDLTKPVRDALQGGLATFKLSAEKSDPAPNVHKEALIKYIINGQQKEKTFQEAHHLNFKEDLN